MTTSQALYAFPEKTTGVKSKVLSVSEIVTDFESRVISGRGNVTDYRSIL